MDVSSSSMRVDSPRGCLPKTEDMGTAEGKNDYGKLLALISIFSNILLLKYDRMWCVLY